MKRLVLSAATIFAASVSCIVFSAADIEAGKAKAALCSGCHGPEGFSSNDLWPNLAGQKKGYLIKQIKDFRDGKRNDPMMKGIVGTLSDQDIENLAAFYSSK